MAVKKYLFDRELVPMILRHTQFVTIKEKDGSERVTTYRLAEGTSELELEKQHPQAKPREIDIRSQILEVKEAHVQKFIESLSYWGRKVKLYEPEKRIKETIDDVRLANKAITELLALSQKDVKVLGYYLYGKESFTDTSDSVLKTLLMEAQEDPQNIFNALETIKDSDYQIAAVSFALKLIYEADGGNAVKWVENDKLITKIPKGKNPLEEFVLYLKTTDGKVIKQELGLQLNETAEAKTNEAIKEKVTEEDSEDKPTKATRGTRATT